MARARRRAAAALVGSALWLTAGLIAPMSSSGASGASAGAPKRASATEVGVVWPHQDSVTRGTRVTLTGEVDGGPRQVLLEHRSRQNGWELLRSATTDAGGAWSLAVPTGWYADHTLRVRAPATEDHAEGVSAPGELHVVPGYEPLGAASSYALNGYRWNPCRAIDYRVRGAKLPSGALADVKQAVRLVAQATGLRFRYRGTSSQVPWQGGESADVRRADLLIGWASAREVPDLAGTVAGLGGVSRGLWSVLEGQLLIDQGMVVLDVASHAAAGFGAGWTRGELLLHEIGHAVGLSHYFADGDQIMAYSTRDRDRYGAGDLAGLQRVGRSAGCLDAEAWGRSARPVALPPMPVPEPR